MRIVRWLGSAILLLGGAALAQDAQPPQDVFETYSGGQLVGTETATRPAPGGPLNGRTEITVAGTKVTFVQEATLDATGRRLVAYRCDIETPNGPARVRAKLGEAGWTLDAGAASVPEPQATKTFPAGATTIVLDNNLASHLDLL